MTFQVKNAFITSSPALRTFMMGLVVFLLSYATAYGETLTIAHVSNWPWLCTRNPGNGALVEW